MTQHNIHKLTEVYLEFYNECHSAGPIVIREICKRFGNETAQAVLANAIRTALPGMR